ncbi:hypothetical protein KI387_043957 [Taxus chinensis]|uniref:Uncharacterized protein n=1 Tax=Taxus chinensis TaxID=29808 RepID=A0AA38LE51_TAXCH|nr:hypothetical protein KI387_043957 [Taxus chinensis]
MSVTFAWAPAYLAELYRGLWACKRKHRTTLDCSPTHRVGRGRSAEVGIQTMGPDRTRSEIPGRDR